MTYSVSRIEEILSVTSAALPAVDDMTFLGASGPDNLVGTYTFSDGSWPRYSSYITWHDITLLTDAGNDTLDGEDGNDRLYPGPGNDTVKGGTGTDAVAFVDALAAVTVDLASGYADGNGDHDTVNGVENVLGSAYGDHIYGDSGANVLDGWEGDDWIYGRAGADDLRGGDGSNYLDGGADDDTILDGSGGDDTLIGGDGDDTLLADPGDDTLEGGAGDDTVSGGSDIDTASYATSTLAVAVSLLVQNTAQNTAGAGWDTLYSIENLRGGEHDDWLFGSDGVNTLEGQGGADHLIGDGGDDLLRGGLGDDSLVGGSGIDRASYLDAPGGVVVSLAAGTASGAAGSDTLSSIEEIGGSPYRDTLVGDRGANAIQAAAGDDYLQGGLGDDALDGGPGTDTASWWGTAGMVTANLGNGLATGVAGNDTLVQIENLVGTDGYGDWLTGGAGDNRLEGWGGNDTLMGRQGADTLVGGQGFDTASYTAALAGVTVDLAAGTASGGDGADTLSGIESVLGSDHGDSLAGGTGAETLDGRNGDDNIAGGRGDDTLIGGSGSDCARYSSAAGSVTVDLAAGTASGADGVDTLSGFEKVIGGLIYGDTLSGDAGANILQGWGGDDLLRGRAGNDTLDGGAGSDRASYDDASGTVHVYLDLGTAYGAAGSDTLTQIEDLTGSAFDDTLAGDSGVNHVDGGDGDDNIYGRGGQDVLDGGDGTDTANYWDAPSFVYVDLGSGAADFGAGYDTLANFENVGGSSWDDQLIGDARVNAISGSGGADTIVGQGDADVLTGGAGADIFMYNAVLEADDDFASLEQITDFVGGTDRIDLSHIDTDVNAGGDQGFTFIGSSPFTASAEAQVRFAGGILYCDNDSDTGAEMEIALANVTVIAATDLLL